MEEIAAFTVGELAALVERMREAGVSDDTALIMSSDAEGNDHHHGMYIYFGDPAKFEIQPWGEDNYTLENCIVVSPGGARAEELWEEE
jgi:hypothetical protein